MKKETNTRTNVRICFREKTCISLIHRRQGVFLQYKPLNCTCKLYSLRIDRSLIYRCLGTEDNPKSKRRMGCLCTTPLKVVHRHCFLFAWWNFYWVLLFWVRSLKVSESFGERKVESSMVEEKPSRTHWKTSWKSFVEWEQLTRFIHTGFCSIQTVDTIQTEEIQVFDAIRRAQLQPNELHYTAAMRSCSRFDVRWEALAC